MEKPGMLQSMGSERVRHVQQMITAVGPTALAQRHLRNVLQARERERGWAVLLGMVQAVLCFSAVTSHEHKSLSGSSGSRV